MAKPIQDLPGEIWKPVVGYEGLYEVSNIGRVKSLDRTVRWRDGHRAVRSRLIKYGVNHRGYFTAHLCRDGIHNKRFVHVLVLEAFVGPRPDGMECCHGNGIRTDNRLLNLRWDTRSANRNDSRAHGTMPIGSKHHNAKLTEPDVIAIRKRCSDGEKPAAVARDYNVTSHAIHRVIRRIIWRHI